jgi:hypothetical protein
VVDVDEHADVADTYDVRAIPTFVAPDGRRRSGDDDETARGVPRRVGVSTSRGPLRESANVKEPPPCSPTE